VLMLAILGLSFLLSMACTCVCMDVSPEYSNPLCQKIIPDFLAGSVHNQGSVFGISGWWSLTPLIVLWAVGGWYLTRQLQVEGQRAQKR